MTIHTLTYPVEGHYSHEHKAFPNKAIAKAYLRDLKKKVGVWRKETMELTGDEHPSSEVLDYDYNIIKKHVVKNKTDLINLINKL